MNLIGGTMSHLRVVKPRSEKIDHDLDLRGLGTEKIIQDHYPWIFLTVTGIEISAIKNTCEIFGVTYKNGTQSNEIHVFHNGKMNHKEKNLTLFTVGLHILNGHHKASMVLGQLDVLRERTIATETSDKTLREENSKDYQKWVSTEPGIRLGESCQLYLSHAGIQISNDLVGIDFVSSVMNSNTHQKNHKKGVG